MLKENSGITFDKVIYSIKQMFLVFIVYCFFTLFTFKAYAHNIIVSIKTKSSLTAPSIFDINNIVMFVLLLYLGTNKGAFMSYHLTLLVPSVIVTGCFAYAKTVQSHTDKAKTILMLIVSTACVLLFIKKYQFPIIYSNSDK